MKTIPEVLAAIDRALPFVAADEEGDPREALVAAKDTIERLRGLMAERQRLEAEMRQLQVESARSILYDTAGRG